MQDKTGPACGKVPFVQLFSQSFSADYIMSGGAEGQKKGVSDVAPGAIVKQIRSSTGLSQRSFAESIGICQSAVGYYESGKHRVSDVIWEKIKSVYHDVIVQLAIPEEMPDEAKKKLPPQSEELRRIGFLPVLWSHAQICRSCQTASKSNRFLNPRSKQCEALLHVIRLSAQPFSSLSFLRSHDGGGLKFSHEYIIVTLS